MFRSELYHDVDRVYARVLCYSNRDRFKGLSKRSNCKLFSASHLDCVVLYSLGALCLGSASSSQDLPIFTSVSDFAYRAMERPLGLVYHALLPPPSHYRYCSVVLVI